uniref:hypothetical protein n=1 Tax=uncultured Draconibacterium sp. TaxID=1573823 RepID=UPI003216C7CC
MKPLVKIVFFFFILSSFQKAEEKIARFQQPSFNSEPATVDSVQINFNDTIPNKTLLIYNDANGYPVKYARHVITGVCIEGECRFVRINLFWNPTGRYLGFELPDGEFLSKTKHVAFKQADYNQINDILSRRPIHHWLITILTNWFPKKTQILKKLMQFHRQQLLLFWTIL